MNNLQSKTLAQIVNANYRAASVFEKYQLDFCCRGKRTLLQACTESDLAIENIEQELAGIAVTGTPMANIHEISLAELSRHIVETHHTYVKKETPSIIFYLNKIASKHGHRHPELNALARVFNELALEMHGHMEKEELEVFPLVAAYEMENEGQLLSGLSSPITLMEDDHEHAGKLLQQIRELTNNFAPPADACTTYKLAFASLNAFQTDLHQHVHLENNILFPKALKLYHQRNTASQN